VNDINKGDSFDIARPGTGGTTVRGSESGSYIVSGQYVPDIHTAIRGNTLWDISRKYFANPYHWPRIWSYNKQIQNPHWIYPGDHIRLKDPTYGVRQVGYGVGFTRRKRMVSPDTVFLRNIGWVRDDKDPAWGEVVGSPDDQMLLSENDQVYIQLDEKRTVTVGQQLTIYEPMDVRNLTDSDLVYVRGTAQVNRYNSKTHMLRARIVESINVIERGAKVGPVDRKIDVVSPTTNEKTIRGRIIGSLYPHAFYAQHTVVFVDRGWAQGVKVGNRFFAVSRGDEWRLTLENAGDMADLRSVTEDDRTVRIETTPDEEADELYPAETFAELLVLRVRENSAACLVTASLREIGRGAIVIARKGY